MWSVSIMKYVNLHRVYNTVCNKVFYLLSHNTDMIKQEIVFKKDKATLHGFQKDVDWKAIC